MPTFGLLGATQFELPGGVMLLAGVRESGVAADSDYLDGAVASGLLYVVDPEAEPPPVLPVYDPLYVARGDDTPDTVYANEGGGVLTPVELPASNDDLLGLAYQLEPLVATVATQDGAGAPLTGTARWPDGGTGVYTITRNGDSAVMAYVVTHVLAAVTTTYTQPTITRDANGVATNRPAITVA